MRAAFFSLLFLPVLALSPAALADDPPAKPAPPKAVVSSVYDGDTLTLNTGDKVRLKWVNTPELKPAEDYGIEAREATKNLCLEREVTLTYGEVKRDGYGRLLAGVECDGQDLSVHLLEQGLGHVFIIPPDSRDPGPLLAAQQKAKDANRGIWSTDRYQGELHITSFHANASGDDRENVNGEYLRVANVSNQPVDLAGYKMTDLSGRSFDLPALIVPPGHTVKVISGKGEHQKNPGEQLEAYLGSDGPVWNNKRDRATLYDRHGRVVDSRDHEVKGEPNK
ncbi:MAG: thermonuclease family protein [Alphaproteobacteria bacterium]|nr:thermonuclease family protein [Alphaproteobacteria bacterium]